MYSSPTSCILSLISLSDPKLELCGCERDKEDGSGRLCFNKSTWKSKTTLHTYLVTNGLCDS
ncbi:hypothetical protein Hanom_Chr05g00415481 [Helianthus anomalus]